MIIVGVRIQSLRIVLVSCEMLFISHYYHASSYKTYDIVTIVLPVFLMWKLRLRKFLAQGHAVESRCGYKSKHSDSKSALTSPTKKHFLLQISLGNWVHTPALLGGRGMLRGILPPPCSRDGSGTRESPGHIVSAVSMTGGACGVGCGGSSCGGSSWCWKVLGSLGGLDDAHRLRQPL